MSQQSTPLPTPEALRECLACRWNELVRLLVRNGFPMDVVEDAVPEAIVRALVWIETGKVATILDRQAWLCQVAVHTGRTILRNRRRYSTALRYEPEDEPFERFDRNEEERVQVAAILEAVRRLPDHLRVVFTLRKVQGLTIRETAIALSLRDSQVSGLLARAVLAIRRELGVS